MKKVQFDAWIITGATPHRTEELTPEWAFRKYISGFTGSAGTVVVTAKEALLWTDSRYWEQAARELKSTDIELMRAGKSDTPRVSEWLLENLPSDASVGIDARTVTQEHFSRLESALSVRGISVNTDETIMGGVWPDRPKAAGSPVFVLEDGQRSVSEKLADVRSSMKAAGAEAHLLTTLEDIAWLTNMRGADFAHTPVFTAFALVFENNFTLYADHEKFKAPDVRKHLVRNGIVLEPYVRLRTDVIAQLHGQSVLLDPKAVPRSIYRQLESERSITVIAGNNPTELLKSRKTDEELALLRETMREDGAAMCELFAWLEAQVKSGTRPHECEIAEELRRQRSLRKGFISESFASIVAFGPNAALPHYSPKQGEDAPVGGDGMLLIDSGGQYCGGTTDITRTVLVGEATPEMKRDFTAGPQGHTSLASPLLPTGTDGAQRATLARGPLWNIGADFGHGTGHGVGFCLSVHEGPVSISPRAAANDAGRLRTGLVLSNEPGLYRPGKHGVRTENLVTPVEDAFNEDPELPMLRFETLTLCPIDTRLIDIAMLSPVEILWLNRYHTTVRVSLMPLLSPRAAAWLTRQTEII